jgi:peptide/nickel transport system permease protein
MNVTIKKKRSSLAQAKAKNAGRSQFGLIVYRFKKNRMAVAGLAVLGVLLLLAIAAPLYANYENAIRQNVSERLQAPSAAHIFGTDSMGRDLFTRIIYGGRISLFAGLAVILIALVFGVTLGGIAGYFGGRVDTVIMRFVDIFMAVPPLLLSLAVCITLGQGTFNLVVALMVADVPRFARIVRASILTLRGQEFVEACKCVGTSHFRIVYKHILPNGIGPVIVSATLALGSAILSIAALGFLGIGVEKPTPEWGTILADNRDFIRHYPHLGIIPGLAIATAVMSVNFIGDGLRDALDPKMKK